MSIINFIEIGQAEMGLEAMEEEKPTTHQPKNEPQPQPETYLTEGEIKSLDEFLEEFLGDFYFDEED